MPPILGIDLGTTNTAVAVLENGRPRVIEDDRGYKVLPSVVSAKGEGRFVVGQAAHNLILTRPDRTVYATKRLIGRRFDSPEVQRVRSRIGYAIQEAPDGTVQLQVGDTWMTPQEVAAVILQVARGIAEKALGEPVEEAVITVPAHFNHAQRKATLEAAEIAGIRCERLLNEPTAAALAYGHRKNVERTLLIFDLGGGTFDVSVLRLASGIYEILASNGDTFLGGEDFDYRIVDHLADQFKARTDYDLRKDRAALQRLKDAAERAKCELSFSDRANIVVAHAAPGENLETVLTRTQLERLTEDLVDKCVDVARDAVVEAGLSISDIDEVILVGGQTRMPRVREAVAGLFGREPSRSVHPEEAVAIGAAVHAATLGDVEAAPAVLLDITPFDLGIDAAGGMFSKIVARNTRVPCSETRVFATAHDDQTTVRVTVRQGESRHAEENEFIGEFLFEGLAPAPRMETKVAVTFRIDANGMLNVSAMEPTTGEKRHISIRSYADRERSVVSATDPAGASNPKRAAVAAAAVATGASAANAKKKAGFFDQLFGSRPKPLNEKAAAKAAKEKAAGKKAAAAKEEAPAPPVGEPTPVAVAEAPSPDLPASLEPPPVIPPLPTPAPPDALFDADDAAPVEFESLGSGLDDEDAAFEMPEELYEPAATPSFGLAGAHQVGASSADPFADLGAPARPSTDPFSRAETRNPTLAPSGESRNPTLAPSGDVLGRADTRNPTLAPSSDMLGRAETRNPTLAPAGETFSRLGLGAAKGPGADEAEGDLFSAAGLDASELFGDMFAEDERDEDPPTDPGLRFPGSADPAAGVSAAPSAPSSPEHGGLHFERLVEGEEHASLDLGFELDTASPTVLPGVEEDLFGFTFADEEPASKPAEPPPAAPPKAGTTGWQAFSGPDPKPARDEEATSTFRRPDPDEATAVFRRPVPGELDDEGFAFPMPDDEAPKKPKKPARIKLQYRERAVLVDECRENLRKGGAHIRTDKPLATGRECVFEINGPGLTEPLVIPARVTRILSDGMEVEYRLDPGTLSMMLASLR